MIENIAKTCHEVNRAYCISLGDNSQPAWDNAEKWQKESAINGVKFHLENPGKKPEDSHQKWVEHKLSEGWKFGPVKDSTKKEHPCLVPYGDLPIEQQTKDYLFIAVVEAMRHLVPEKTTN